MKRQKTIFIALNILVAIIMLIHIGYDYSLPHLSVPRAVSFCIAFFYLPPLILINGIWLLIRMVHRYRSAREVVRDDRDGMDEQVSEEVRLRRLNIIFVTINLVLTAMMAIHNIIYSLIEGGSFVLNLFGVALCYVIPIMIINAAWVIISMDIKKKCSDCR